MKIKISVFVVLLVYSIAAWGQVNGDLQQIGDKKILRVWGDHYSRGHAQGYLLAEEVMDVFEDYFFSMQALSDPAVYANLRDVFEQSLVVDCGYLAEASGLIAGLTDALGSTYFEPLSRHLDPTDILLLNSSMDLAPVSNILHLPGSAVLASWGDATASNAGLAGSSVLTRFFDWVQYPVLIQNPVMVVHYPQESDQQKWISIGYPGFIGAISAISEDKSAAFVGAGNVHDPGSGGQRSPILFSVRRGIEKLDYDQSGVYDADDLWTSINTNKPFSGFVVQSLYERPDYFHASVIEANGQNAVRRLPGVASDLPAGHLASTGHFRLLASPVCCDRYYLLQDSLFTNPQIDPRRQWSVMSGAAGMENNLMALQYIPGQNYLLWSTATPDSPAYQNPGLTLDLNQYFEANVSSENETAPQATSEILVYPNPVSISGQITVSSGKIMQSLELYNLRGQKVLSRLPQGRTQSLSLSSSGLAGGIYFLRASLADGSSTSRKLLIVD